MQPNYFNNFNRPMQNGGRQNFNQFNNPIVQMLMSGNSPQQIINIMMQNNPQVKSTFEQMRNSGMSSRDFVTQYAKQNNINIEPLINMMNQSGFH